MDAVTLWGTVVPAWLGGVGGIAGAAISTVALILSLRNRGGVDTLKKAANSAPSAPAISTAIAAGGASITAVSPVSWTQWRESKGHYRLRNDSTNNGATATLTGFRDVTPDGDDAASYAGPLPVILAAGESVPFSIEKSLVSPSVTAVELTWLDGDGTEHKRNVYI